jgi:hypothetical protein
LLGGITTTPSKSATMRSPGLIVSGSLCSGDVNSTETFNAVALVNVFEPSDDDDFANSCLSSSVSALLRVAIAYVDPPEISSPYAH